MNDPSTNPDPNVRLDRGGWISGPSLPRPAVTAAGTIAGVLPDLSEVLRRLASGLPLDALETEHMARILDRLSEETAEAAALLRGGQPS